ncbi:hypothetical protein DRQ36_01930 [bacterium]|nr:MAG: hypothetical protein DRQ36_01930 [bacterium]
MKKVIILVRSAPYGVVTALESYRIAQAIGEQDTRVVLVEDGVFVGTFDQNPEAIGMHHMRKTFEMLEDFGPKIYLLDKHLADRGVPESKLTFGEVINWPTLKKWVDEADFVFNLT